MTTRRFLFNRTARTVVGKVSSHMVDCLWNENDWSILCNPRVSDSVIRTYLCVRDLKPPGREYKGY